MNFCGKVVLLTGASSGIGATTAVEFARLGASLSLTGLESLKAVAAKCKQELNCVEEPLTIEADLTKEADTVKIMDKTIEKFAKLDVLVNNAGILESGSIENTSLEQYDRIFNTNVRSVYHLTMLATPYLIKTKGNIVNVSSVVGVRSFPGILAYCMSKSAIDQFTKCVALDLAPKQIRVNSVNPGLIITNLHKRSGMSEENYTKFVEKSKETHALGRAGMPEEVARVITFLASDQASFITAVNLSVDGGKHALCPR